MELGEIFAARSSLVDPTLHENRFLPHLGPDSIGKGSGRLLPFRTADADGVTSGKYRFETGDILYSKIRPNLNKVVRVGFPGLCSADMYALDVNSEVADPDFVVHLLRSPKFVSYANSVSSRANIPKINRGQLLKFEFEFPAIDEQRRIAAILDHADALRAKRRLVLAHLDDLTQSIFYSMFGRFRDWKWSTAQVREVGRVQLGRQRAPKYQTGNWSRPYLRVANVQMDWLKLGDVLTMDFNPKDFEAYRLEEGDILLNEGQNTEFVGRPAIWRGEIDGCCFQNTLVRFQPDRTRLTPEFAQHVFLEFLRSGQFARISSKTSNVAHLGKERFASMDMPLPPLVGQTEFSAAVDAIRSQRKRLAQAGFLDDELFASLQARAFRGEL